MKQYEKLVNELISGDGDTTKEDNQKIMDMTVQKLCENFKIRISPAIVGLLFKLTKDSIIDELKRQTYKNTEFKINVCDRLEMGFENDITVSDGLEKMGNITLNYKNLNCKKRNTKIELDDTPVDSLTTWSSENIIDNRTILDKIAIEVAEKAKAYNIVGMPKELVWAAFALTYELAVGYVTIARAEKGEYCYSLNLLGSMYIESVESDSDDATAEIVILPSMGDKQKMKDDEVASSFIKEEDV